MLKKTAILSFCFLFSVLTLTACDINEILKARTPISQPHTTPASLDIETSFPKINPEDGDDIECNKTDNTVKVEFVDKTRPTTSPTEPSEKSSESSTTVTTTHMPTTTETITKTTTPTTTKITTNKAEYLFVGNKSSKIFHHKDCSSVREMNEGNKVFFKTIDEAVRAGFTPCQRCNPSTPPVTTTTTTTKKPTTTKPSTTTPTTTTKPTTTTGTNPPSTTTSIPQEFIFRDDMANEALIILNQERAAVGKPPLKMNSSLVASAKIRAQEIVELFSHTRPNGKKWSTAITLGYSCAAENIAAGQTSPQRVIDSWMGSEGHRINMLDENNKGYTDIGFVCLQIPNFGYRYYWVQLFIKP